MKLHITDLWHHASHEKLAQETPTNWQNVLYTGMLIVGIPAVVIVTMYMVRYLYAGVIWLVPG